jgi:hypothetical protein
MEPPRNGRAGNYTMDEDILLCVKWKQVGTDATMGINQKGDTYWTRIKEFFDAHNKSGYERTDTLRSRWGIISSE